MFAPYRTGNMPGNISGISGELRAYTFAILAECHGAEAPLPFKL